MEQLGFILLLFGAVLLSSVISQVIPKISTPLIQIALGFLLVILPINTNFEFNPDIILLLFIAPLLFEDSRKSNKFELWTNRRQILSLAIGLVIATTLIVGFVTHLLAPSIPLAAAFALGAALGPTDAVAVMSLSKQTSLSKNQEALLSGEALINDASGVVSFQFAVAAAVTGTFSVLSATTTFLLDFFGGIALGIALMYLALLLVRFVRNLGLDNITFHVMFEIMLPFLIYLIAEVMGVSGILAVVAGGIFLSFNNDEMTPNNAKQSIVSTNVWNAISFALNGFVFILLGSQMPHVFNSLLTSSAVSNSQLILLVLAVTAIVVVTRYIWTRIMVAHNTKSEDPRQNKFNKRENRRNAAILTFAGAKGAVTLAVIYSLPFTMSTGEFFPERDLLVFIASGAILITLVLANFLVPVLSPAPVHRTMVQDEAEAVAEILRNVVSRLQATITAENRLATEGVIESYNIRIEALKEEHDVAAEQSYRDLQKRAVNWEREYTQKQIEEETFPRSVGLAVLNAQRARLSRIENRDEFLWMLRAAVISVRAMNKRRKQQHKAKTAGEELSRETRHALENELAANACEYAIEKLLSTIDDAETGVEDITRIVRAYRQRIDGYRDTNPSLTRITKADDIRVDVEARGLRYEAEEIQQMLDDGRISRARAKRMRDNVSLMELDRIDKFE